MGIGDWGLGIGPNPQSPIPNPQLIFKSYRNSNYLFFNFQHYLIKPGLIFLI
jgi:hypothetical protein